MNEQQLKAENEELKLKILGLQADKASLLRSILKHKNDLERCYFIMGSDSERIDELRNHIVFLANKIATIEGRTDEKHSRGF
jgi:uncharacterized coiled-coil DUF342 family protein